MTVLLNYANYPQSSIRRENFLGLRLASGERKEAMNSDSEYSVINIADDTVIYAPTSDLGAIIRDQSTWVRWWPDLTLQVYGDRGEKGLRWTVTGALVGSSEIWLEAIEGAPAGEVATIVHYYLRASPTRSGSEIQSRSMTNSAREQREIHKLRERHVLAWKRSVWALKDSMEKPND